jgi:hypothetical protein
MKLSDALIGALIIILVICLFVLYIKSTDSEKYTKIVNVNDGQLEKITDMQSVPQEIGNREDNIIPQVPQIFRIRWEIPPRFRFNGVKSEKKFKKPINSNGNREEKGQQYYGDLEEHDNDSQNVHDSSVVKVLRKKYEKLVELLPSNFDVLHAGVSLEEIQKAKIAATFLELEEKIKKYYNVQHKNQKITGIVMDLNIRKSIIFLEEVKKGFLITSIEPEKGVKEDWVLTLVWERIHQPVNKENCEKMEIALIDQILEGVKKKSPLVHTFLNLMGFPQPQDDTIEGTHNPVCINGRVGHILASLTLLDNDPVLSEPEKDEKEVANLAYWKAGKITTDLLSTWVPEESMKLSKKTIKELYNDVSDTLTENEKSIIGKFEKHCKLEIEKELKKEYSGMISDEKLEDIISKAQQGV